MLLQIPAAADIANSTLGTGTKKLISDASTYLMVLCPIAGAMAGGYFFIRRSMRNFAKRARKYEAALWLVTHSLVDLLNEKVKLSGQTILDCATYKIFFGTDGKNLEETASLFHLTDTEQNILLAQQRGKALFLLGKQHIHVLQRRNRSRQDLRGRLPAVLRG